VGKSAGFTTGALSFLESIAEISTWSSNWFLVCASSTELAIAGNLSSFAAVFATAWFIFKGFLGVELLFSSAKNPFSIAILSIKLINETERAHCYLAFKSLVRKFAANFFRNLSVCHGRRWRGGRRKGRGVRWAEGPRELFVAHLTNPTELSAQDTALPLKPRDSFPTNTTT
jgi:hypothetical protein